MPAKRTKDPDVWMPIFLSALGKGSITAASKAAGLSPATAYYYRNRDTGFAKAWDAAHAASGTISHVSRPRSEPAPHRYIGWRTTFLEALVETSNVTAAATRAGVPLRTVYKTRRHDAAFAAKWRAALHEGYDNLEMELLGHLRDANPARKLDVASALRLLVAHRETVARERALREDDDEQAVLDSIDAFIEDMRRRRLANTAILAEAGEEAGDDAG